MNIDKVSIEFGHIYTDERPSSEHIKGAQIAYDLAKNAHKDISLVVLIDNYNPTYHILDIERYTEVTLSRHGVNPHAVIFESDLVSSAMQLLTMIQDRHLKKGYENYIQSKAKVPCSLLTAAWYLIRLGRLKIEPTLSDVSSLTTATELINILPERFNWVEAKAMRIISAIKLSHPPNIRHISFLSENVPYREFY